MTRTLSNRTKWLATAGVLVLCLTTTTVARADDAELYAKALTATAWVSIPGVGDGTGWVVDREQKLVITNKHVVGTATDAVVMFPIYRRGGEVVTFEGEYVRQ